jgi:hypothetical protein
MGDFVAGLLVGVGSVALMGGVNTPLVVAALGRRGTKRLAWALLLTSLCASVYGASACCGAGLRLGSHVKEKSPACWSFGLSVFLLQPANGVVVFAAATAVALCDPARSSPPSASM